MSETGEGDWGGEGSGRMEVEESAIEEATVRIEQMKPGEDFRDFAKRLGNSLSREKRFGLLQNPDKPREVAIITFGSVQKDSGELPRGWRPGTATEKAIQGE